MKKIAAAVFVLGGMVLGSAVRAEDLAGKLGMNISVGPSFIVGGAGAQDASRVGPHVGAGVEYNLTNALAANFAYDDLENGIQAQLITFGATWRPFIQPPWSPFFGAAAGFGHRYSGDGWDHFGMKLYGGVEHFVDANISVAALLSYYYVAGPDYRGFGDVHAIEPGVRLNYRFATH